MAEPSSLIVAADAHIEWSRRPNLGLPSAAAPVGAEPLALHGRATSAQALVTIALSCLRQIALNEAGVRAGSGESVHQMRVGLRRLRAALSIFKSVLQTGEFDGLKSELAWLTEQLAAAREYDVLIGVRRKFADVASGVTGAESAFTCELARRQREAFARASRAVTGARFERLIGSWAIALLSRTNEGGKGDLPVRNLARRVLERRTRRLLERLERFSELGVVERHELRIFVKKLRYATGYFGALFPNRSGKRFSHALEALQDTLGDLNDIAAHQRLALELIEDNANDSCESRRVAFAIGALSGAEHAELRSVLATVPKLRARLAHAPRFWR